MICDGHTYTGMQTWLQYEKREGVSGAVYKQHAFCHITDDVYIHQFSFKNMYQSHWLKRGCAIVRLKSKTFFAIRKRRRVRTLDLLVDNMYASVTNCITVSRQTAQRAQRKLRNKYPFPVLEPRWLLYTQESLLVKGTRQGRHNAAVTCAGSGTHLKK